MSVAIRINLNEKLYLRNPQDTKLGRNIIQYSITLIDELGFEGFTFKKLANKIESTEASIYRYFENKHLLLTYLVSWYWEWVTFQIDMNTLNIKESKAKLSIAIHALVESSIDSPVISFVNESILHRIVIAEASKAYHTKEVDSENKKGFFISFNNLVLKLTGIITSVNSKFPYPQTLASTLIEMSYNHIFFAEHLPKLTDVRAKNGNYTQIVEMMEYFSVKMLT